METAVLDSVDISVVSGSLPLNNPILFLWVGDEIKRLTFLEQEQKVHLMHNIFLYLDHENTAKGS